MNDIEQYIIDNGIVQITVMPPHEISPERFSVIRRGADNPGFGETLQEAFDDCKVVRND